MKKIVFSTLLLTLAVSAYAENQSAIPVQEQALLPMKIPNEGKAQHSKWLPISPEIQEAPNKNTASSGKTINESIKTLIQKRMQSLLQPMDDEPEH